MKDRILGSHRKRFEQIGDIRFFRIGRLLQGEAEEFETRDRMVMQRHVEALGFAGRVSQANGTELTKVLDLCNQGLSGSIEDQILVAGQMAAFSTELSSLIATAPRPIADATFEATVFIASRGEGLNDDEEWEKVADWDESCTRQLSMEDIQAIKVFASNERFGWPAGEGMGGNAKKARAPRAPRKPPLTP